VHSQDRDVRRYDLILQDVGDAFGEVLRCYRRHRCRFTPTATERSANAVRTKVVNQTAMSAFESRTIAPISRQTAAKSGEWNELNERRSDQENCSTILTFERMVTYSVVSGHANGRAGYEDGHYHLAHAQGEWASRLGTDATSPRLVFISAADLLFRSSEPAGRLALTCAPVTAAVRAADSRSHREEAHQLRRHLGRALLRHPVAAARDTAARHVGPELLRHRDDLRTVRMLSSEVKSAALNNRPVQK